MQCYEYELMRRQLVALARSMNLDLRFQDPRLDDVLADTGCESLGALVSTDPELLRSSIERVVHRLPMAA